MNKQPKNFQDNRLRYFEIVSSLCFGYITYRDLAKLFKCEIKQSDGSANAQVYEMLVDGMVREFERRQLIPARAKNTARVIVAIENGKATTKPPDQIRQIKKTVAINPVSNRPVLTKETLIDLIRERNPETADLAKKIIDNLESIGLQIRGFRSQISYGVKAGGDFLSIVSLTSTGIWFSLTKRATDRLGPGRVKQFKQKVNDVGKFYKPDSLSEPTNRGGLGPHYDILREKDKMDSFVKAVNDIKKQIESSMTAAQ